MRVEKPLPYASILFRIPPEVADFAAYRCLGVLCAQINWPRHTLDPFPQLLSAAICKASPDRHGVGEKFIRMNYLEKKKRCWLDGPIYLSPIVSRQIGSQFYERTALSKEKAAMLRKAEGPLAEDLVTPEEEIKDPYVLEFLNLKDEYSESDLEDARIRRLEDLLLELGSDFTFVGRQCRLRIDDEWHRVDLLFFHRRLRRLVVIDLKLEKLTHADAGQMHMYLNYAREHWTHPDENPPVGLILCATKGEALAKYALEGLPNKVLAAEYRTALPDEKTLAEEIKKTKEMLEARRLEGPGRESEGE